MDVLILGRKETLYETALLLSRRHRICGILTAPAQPEYARTEHDFQELARTFNCPFLLSRHLGEAERAFIRQAKPEIAASVNWVGTVQQDVLDLIPRGILNAHFGDLPRYQGNAVANWAILNHEPSIQLTIHFMQPGSLDSGDIVAQKGFELTEDTTVADLLQCEVASTPALFEAAIDGLAAGTLIPRSQGSTGKKAFRCYPRLPEYSKLNWTSPARDLHALVRASTHPYSGAFTYHRWKEELRKLYVWSSRLVAVETADFGVPGHIIRHDPDSGESWVLTGRGILAIRLAQYAGEPAFQPGKVWTSIRMKLGLDLEQELFALWEKARRP